MVPNIIHFVFGLKEDFGGQPFSFIHYLTVISAYRVNKPEKMNFYYKYEPTGEWWEKCKPLLSLIKVEPPKEIFGNPLLHVAHQADVLRLEILINNGGIYLDMDILCLNSFHKLRKHNCVMGMEENIGLCNAVIIAKPNAEFLRIWYQTYKTFRSKGRDEFWNEHSVKIPWKLSKERKELIHIEDKYAFFWPNYSGSPLSLWESPSLRSLNDLQKIIKKWFVLQFITSSYCIHLTESLWWDKYLKDIDLEYITTKMNNFSLISRMVLSPVQKPLNKKTNLFRPFMKSLIDCYLPDSESSK